MEANIQNYKKQKQRKTTLKKQEEANLEQGHNWHRGYFMAGGEDSTVEIAIRPWI